MTDERLPPGADPVAEPGPQGTEHRTSPAGAGTTDPPPGVVLSGPDGPAPHATDSENHRTDAAPAPGEGPRPGNTTGPDGSPGGASQPSWAEEFDARYGYAGPTSRPEDRPPGDDGALGSLGAYVRRQGLIRPRQGRNLAGVCAGFGRATNTDPVLWRVILAVLVLFGGVGVLAYLLAWLIMPAEGDAASPLEGLLGRGVSSASTGKTILVAVASLISLAIIVGAQPRPGLIGLLALGVGAYLLLRDRGTAGLRARPGTEPVPPPAERPEPATGVPSAFAPRGPFQPATDGDEAEFRWPGQDGLSTSPVVAAPPAPPAPQSRPLTLLTFSLIMIAIGTVALVDLTTSVPPSAYAAAALSAVAAGLIIGAWYGRARGMIFLGLLLSLALAFSTAGERWFGPDWTTGGSTRWTPQTVAELNSPYRVAFGEGFLDLRDLDFSGTDAVTVEVNVAFAHMEVLLPPDVDVEITADIAVGDADLLGRDWSGIRPGGGPLIDLGADGEGGGKLILKGEVDAGNLEVKR